MQIESKGINERDFTIMMFSLRYALGRCSYAPAFVCDYLNAKIPVMNKTQMERVIQELDYFGDNKLYADNLAMAQGLMLRKSLAEALRYAEGHEESDSGAD